MKTHNVILIGIIAMLAFTGCTQLTKALYTPDEVEATQVSNVQVLPDGEHFLVTLPDGSKKVVEDSAIADERIKAAAKANPTTDTTGSAAAVGSKLHIGEDNKLIFAEPISYKTKETVEAGAKFLGLIPVGGEFARILLEYGLFLGGAWLHRKKSIADKTNVSLVKGVDAGRDALQHLPNGQGETADKVLTSSLKEYQKEIDVAKNVVRLIADHCSPDKKKLVNDVLNKLES